jgi:hypothetical protein
MDWSLTIGAVIVGLVLLIAIAGPKIAPHDPMQTNFAVPVGSRIYSPPFPAFTVPGYPLGSDQFGRDLFSRLLWAVAPTLLMIIPVALVRLLLGMLIGLGSQGHYSYVSGRCGYNRQRQGLDGLRPGIFRHAHRLDRCAERRAFRLPIRACLIWERM